MDSQHNPELQSFYKLSKHQLSDLLFLSDEVKFLKSLLDKHFFTMIQDSNINRIQLINRQLTQLIMIKANVTKDLLTQQGNLNAVINGLQPKSIDLLKLENERMDAEIKDLNKCFKNIKKEIFAAYKDINSNETQEADVLS